MQSITEILRVLFDVPLKQNEIKYFRGAVIESVLRNKPYFDAKEIKTDLFHNHNEKKDDLTHTLTRYPLIQYTQFGGKAAIVAIGLGVQALKAFLEIMPGQLQFNNRVYRFGILDEFLSIDEITQPDVLQYYQLTNWIGLKEDKYALWQQTEAFRERISILEDALHGSISRLMYCLEPSLGNVTSPVIYDFLKKDVQAYKTFNLNTFDLIFSSCYVLPGYVCIGKGCGLGFGQLAKFRKN